MTRIAKVCARGDYVPRPMHGKCTCGARCVKYTTKEPNMFLMKKHEKPQSLVLIGVQTSEKMFKKTFYQTSSVHIMNNNVKQCINIMKSTLNTCYFCHKVPTSKVNHQKKPIPYKNLTKIKFP